MRIFTGCIIDESLSDLSLLAGFTPFAERTVDVPNDPDAKVWHVRWYQLREPQLQSRLDALAAATRPNWYAHFWGGDDLCVILPGRPFWVKVSDRGTHQAMLEYGETVGVTRKWTENIPTQVPAWAAVSLPPEQA